MFKNIVITDAQKFFFTTEARRAQKRDIFLTNREMPIR